MERGPEMDDRQKVLVRQFYGLYHSTMFITAAMRPEANSPGVRRTEPVAETRLGYGE
jgi:hypothetical protein